MGNCTSSYSWAIADLEYSFERPSAIQQRAILPVINSMFPPKTLGLLSRPNMIIYVEAFFIVSTNSSLF
jgi:hypothetical protein